MPGRPGETEREAEARYRLALAKMQTGVNAAMKTPGASDYLEGEKHLRVGINAAQRDSGSLAGLLIRKGLITEAEVMGALADGMEEEVAAYEAELSKALGAPIVLTPAGEKPRA